HRIARLSLSARPGIARHMKSPRQVPRALAVVGGSPSSARRRACGPRRHREWSRRCGPGRAFVLHLRSAPADNRLEPVHPLTHRPETRRDASIRRPCARHAHRGARAGRRPGGRGLLMSRRVGLRWKILVLTALPLLALAGATLWLVDRGVSERSQRAVAEDLRRAAGVFENMLAETAAELE